MNRIRLAMWGDGPAYKKAFAALEAQLTELAGARQDRVDENWAELKKLGRG